MQYGNPPRIVATHIETPDDSTLFVLYLPVRFPRHFVRLPELTLPYGRLLDLCLDDFGDIRDYYIYLTVKRTPVFPGVYHNRPGWHSDGFGTKDINYIWYDTLPTEFNDGPFLNIDDSHQRSMDQFEKQVDVSKNYDFLSGTLLRLDPSVIHRTPEIKTSTMRTFVKISFSKDRYNLKGNTHNPLFDYNWKMFDREEVRNHPAFAEADSIPETGIPERK